MVIQCREKGQIISPTATFCYRVSSSLSTRAIFSQMRSKGSQLHSGGLGVWGLRVCSLDVAFMFATVRKPFATVRVRAAWPCLWQVLQKGSLLEVAPCRIASFSRGRRGGTSWDIQTCFVTCRKSFCVAGAMLLRRFQKMRCSFRGGRSTLDVSIVILRGRGQHFKTCRVACFLRMALSGLRQVATRCKFRGRCGILRDVMKIGGSLARNIDF